MGRISESMGASALIKLSPGITRGQVGVYIVTVIAHLCILGFLGLFQPYFLTEMLQVPKADQGIIVGGLATTLQLASMIFVVMSGAFADILGRRWMLIMAFALWATLLFVYPFVSLLYVLFAVHFFFGMASSANTGAGTAIMADYPANNSRGKFVSMILAIQGFAVFVAIGLVGGHIPAWLIGKGLSPAMAGRDCYWLVSGMAVIGLIASGIFMRRDHNIRSPQQKSVKHFVREFTGNLAKVLAHARKNRKFAIVLLMGFASRSDAYIVLTFVSLWVTRTAADAGIDTATALKSAGYMLAIFHVAIVITPLGFGFLVDRLNRTTLLILSCGLTGVSFISITLISEVVGFWPYAVVALIGMTESAMVVSNQAIMGEESPPDLRGACMGIFAFLGSISLVVISLVGGYLFDLLSYIAPFVMVGILNICFALIGFIAVMRRRSDPLIAR